MPDFKFNWLGCTINNIQFFLSDILITLKCISPAFGLQFTKSISLLIFICCFT